MLYIVTSQAGFSERGWFLTHRRDLRPETVYVIADSADGAKNKALVRQFAQVKETWPHTEQISGRVTSCELAIDLLTLGAAKETLRPSLFREYKRDLRRADC